MILHQVNIQARQLLKARVWIALACENVIQCDTITKGQSLNSFGRVRMLFSVKINKGQSLNSFGRENVIQCEKITKGQSLNSFGRVRMLFSVRKLIKQSQI
jgi:hypothetical protein